MVASVQSGDNKWLAVGLESNMGEKGGIENRVDRFRVVRASIGQSAEFGALGQIHLPLHDSLKRMLLDLEALRTEVQTYLEQSEFAVFHGSHHALDSLNEINWDTERHPDFREFLEAARKAGARLVVFHHQAFSLDRVHDALEELEEADFTREEKRAMESRLRQLQDYEGFTCAIELSFSMEARVYLYELHTDWYESLTDILAELDAATEMDDEEEDGSLGGYFSRN